MHIKPHLSYHEQGAAYAACGYAQYSGELGVAYSTRGPGFTNMVTAIADAYYDSIPVMFITAHSSKDLDYQMRVLNNQEIDTIKMVTGITKRAVRIDYIDDFQREIILAYNSAMKGRKGPVVLDIWNGLFSENVDDYYYTVDDNGDEINDENGLFEFVKTVEQNLSMASRPVLLIGNGVRQYKELIIEVSSKYSIPVLSSRSGQDIINDYDLYFGYIGSHATRYSNFILSKSDLIVAIGNRLSFPVDSKSFRPIIDRVKIIRIDIDSYEFDRIMPNSINYKADAGKVLEVIKNSKLHYLASDEWLATCIELRNILNGWDKSDVINTIGSIMNFEKNDNISYVCDVGNHSFWVTIAFAYRMKNNRVMYSSSFGALGSALPKAIGIYYKTRQPVICFVGDQGIQLNIQELQYIGHYRLPITVVIINNQSSGMIREREIEKYGDKQIHTTLDDGYSIPDFKSLARGYGIDYYAINVFEDIENRVIDNPTKILEIMMDSQTVLCPNLPKGNPCQDLYPYIHRELYNMLDKL